MSADIDLACRAARARLRAYINRMVAQQLRRMREHWGRTP